MVGLALIGRELTGPGRIVPGVLGAAITFTSVWSLSGYGFAPLGLLLLAAAVALIILQGFRRLWFVPGIAGAVLAAVAARLLLRSPWAISWLAAASASVVGLFAGWLWYIAVRARRSKLSA